MSSPSELSIARSEFLNCSPLSPNNTLLRCSPLCAEGSAGEIMICQPVAGTNGQLLNCMPEAEVAEAWRDFLRGFWRVPAHLLMWAGALWDLINGFTKAHPLLTGIPLLALGAMDLLALVYCAAVLLQETLRPSRSGRNAYLLLVTDTSVERPRVRAFAAYPLPTIHATMTVVGAVVGVWGLFILGRWFGSLGA